MNSLREQVDTLKQQANDLAGTGKLSREAELLFSSLWILVDVMVAVFMEKKTKKTARNSSIPPSQSDLDQSTPVAQNTQQSRTTPNHNTSCRSESVTITTLVTDTCSHCQTSLADEPCQRVERRTLIDIRFEKMVQHVDAPIKVCPQCTHTNKPCFPAPFVGPKQYGLGIKVFVLNLLVVQMVSLKRAQTLVHGLVDQVLSQTTMLNYVLALHDALQRWEEDATQWLLQQTVMHVDETSLRVDKRNQWIHVYASGPITLKRLHPKRGHEAIQSINLIPQYPGVIIHDCWASYLTYDQCGHGLCGSHLLRELTFVVDSNGYPWARHMKRLLKHTCRVVSCRHNKKLSSAEYQKLLALFVRILNEGTKQMPAIPEKKAGKRGKVAKSAAHNLHERLQKYQQAVLLFANDTEVPFTNNRAERDLRMSKVKQKVSGCFRQTRFAEAYCRISSYIQTMSAKGYNPITAIEMAFSGELYVNGGG